jgi:hypothetical protein
LDRVQAGSIAGAATRLSAAPTELWR